MIINLLINLILLIFGSLFVFFPTVTIASLPYVGPYVSSALINVATLWNSFLVFFPYALTPWHVFLFVILPFEGFLLLMRFFLGHRTPVNN